MRLNVVVLPAPLGPMSATASPAFTVKSTPLTAANPPNDFFSPTTSSASFIVRSDALRMRSTYRRCRAETAAQLTKS